MTPCTGAPSACLGRRLRGLGPGLLFLVALVAIQPAEVRAADASGGPLATAREARLAIEVFRKASRSHDLQEQIEAVNALGACLHEKVAARLLKLVRAEEEGPVLAAAFAALARQQPFAAKIVPKLAARLEREAAAARERAARNDGGFRTDPRTGDADTTSPEGLARLRATQERAGMLVALLTALDALGGVPKASPPDLTPFLQDPSDELVAAVLGKLGAWKAWSALPAILELFRMYPTDARWETGAVIDLAGTNASAKATWMARFGHPDKQRARPRVHEALQGALQAITERTFPSPGRLALYLQRDDVESRIDRPRRRR